MVVTNDRGLYERLKLFRSHGITREEDLLEGEGPDRGEGWYYQQLELGYNYRMTDFQAALGTNQMGKLPGFLERRRGIAVRYGEAFAGNPGIGLPQVAEGAESGWHLYAARFPARRRREIFRGLRAAGVGVNVHYIPVYRHPYYQKHGYEGVCCPAAEELYGQMISLPVYPGLTEEEQEYVIREVLRYFS